MTMPLFTIDTDPPPEDVARLSNGLTQHALPYTKTAGFQPLAALARDEAGELLGGATGKINWNWLQVDLLWVAEECRSQGLGSQLLSMLESEAVDRGCTMAHVDTFSFQAQDFYQALGYQVFAVLEDYPTGYQRVSLQKKIP